jgi:hypothetical protein
VYSYPYQLCGMASWVRILNKGNYE